jgi:hypothetical protein
VDPFSISLLAGGVSVAGTVLGELFSSGRRQEAEAILRAALDEYGQIDLPKLERIVAEQLGPSALESVKTDPRLRDAQYNALAKLQTIEDSGGLTLEDRAVLNRQLGEANRSAQAQQSSILNSMRARGVGGSGAELALMQANQQGAAQRAADAGLDTAAAAQRRYIDSILQRGEMAGRVRGQEYGEASRAAEAKDLIARYNADARERGARYNNDLMQQRFGNQMQMATARNNARSNIANAKLGQAAQTQQLWNNMAQGTAYGLNSYAQYKNRPKYDPIDDPNTIWGQKARGG